MRRSQLKARLLGKLALFAFDRQLAEACVSALSQAVDTARSGSRLQRALLLAAVNNDLIRPIPAEVFKPSEDVDPLVDQDWIDALALRAARADLEDLLQARARSPWSWQFRTGRTPVDEIIAAELQATWAGAWWLRPTLRTQLGAQILRAPPEREDSLVYGLSMWITGGGRDIRQVIDLAEPEFTSATADALTRPLIAALRLPDVGDTRLSEAAASLWDLFSDETAMLLLDRLQVTEADDPYGAAARRYWALMAFRDPAEVGRRLLAMQSKEIAALLPELSLTALETLPIDAAAHALNSVLEDESDAPVLSGATAGAAATFGQTGSFNRCRRT